MPTSFKQFKVVLYPEIVFPPEFGIELSLLGILHFETSSWRSDEVEWNSSVFTLNLGRKLIC